MAERTFALTTWLTEIEWKACKSLAAKNNITASTYFRAALVDALVEEGYDLQPNQHPPRSPRREGREVQGSNPT